MRAEGCCAGGPALFEVELIIIENRAGQARGQGNMKMLARKTALEWLAQYQP